jgi:hypothetical protein
MSSSHEQGFPADDRDEVIAEAETSVGRTPEERNAMFASIQRLVGSIWEQLSREEMRRRLRIAEELDPRPEPWWRNIRREENE